VTELVEVREPGIHARLVGLYARNPLLGRDRVIPGHYAGIEAHRALGVVATLRDDAEVVERLVGLRPVDSRSSNRPGRLEIAALQIHQASARTAAGTTTWPDA